MQPALSVSQDAQISDPRTLGLAALRHLISAPLGRGGKGGLNEEAWWGKSQTLGSGCVSLSLALLPVHCNLGGHLNLLWAFPTCLLCEVFVTCLCEAKRRSDSLPCAAGASVGTADPEHPREWGHHPHFLDQGLRCRGDPQVLQPGYRQQEQKSDPCCNVTAPNPLETTSMVRL